jgi:hypothetical protein
VRETQDWKTQDTRLEGVGESVGRGKDTSLRFAPMAMSRRAEPSAPYRRALRETQDWKTQDTSLEGLGESLGRGGGGGGLMIVD